MTTPANHATFLQRLLALTYDGLIIFFVIVVVQALLIFLLMSGLKMEMPTGSPLHLALKSLWFIISFFYFGYYWTKSGQTPGMKVWKIKVQTANGELISWLQSLLRYLFAFLGLGLFVLFFNKKRLALQDIVSKTHLISLK